MTRVAELATELNLAIDVVVHDLEQLAPSTLWLRGADSEVPETVADQERAYRTLGMAPPPRASGQADGFELLGWLGGSLGSSPQPAATALPAWAASPSQDADRQEVEALARRLGAPMPRQRTRKSVGPRSWQRASSSGQAPAWEPGQPPPPGRPGRRAPSTQVPPLETNPDTVRKAQTPRHPFTSNAGRSRARDLAEERRLETFGLPRPQTSARRRRDWTRQQLQTIPEAKGWHDRGFSPEAYLEWTRAGLGVHDSYIADQCRRQGLVPSDLEVRVAGRKIAQRIRGGEPVVVIADMLRQQRSQVSGGEHVD